MMESKVILVTGPRGIGRAITKSLLLNSPPKPKLIVYLLGRSLERTQAVSDELKAEIGGQGTGHELRIGTADVLDHNSLDNLKKRLETECGKVDVLINNAGKATLFYCGIAISGPRFDEEVVRDALATNYYGSKNVTHTLLPLIQRSSSPRVVNVASSAGLLSIIPSSTLRGKFSSADATEQSLDEAVEEFVSAVKAGDCKEKGWPTSGYGMSKVALTAWTKVFARQHPAILVNSCCPGWVKTDMAPRGTRTPAQGAKTPVFLAIGDIKGHTSGEFWMDEKVAKWV